MSNSQKNKLCIRSLLAAAKKLLAKAATDQASIEGNISKALDLLENSGRTYQTSGTKFQRQYNQALFERIDIGHQDEGITITSELTDNYKPLIHPTIIDLARNAQKWR